MKGTHFALPTFSNGLANVSEDIYNRYLRENFGTLANAILEYYPWSAFQNTPCTSFFAVSTTFTQALFFCPSYLALKAAITSGLPARTYLFSHGPTCP